jgi:uncharacterized membrane protein YbaN (DUF454 family)
MFVPRRPLGIFIMILAFIALTIVAAIQYSRSTSSDSYINEQPWYRFMSRTWELGQNLATDLQNSDINLKTSTTLLLNEENNMKNRYIQIFKHEGGWQLILQNKNGVILDKYWPRIFSANN